MSKFLVECWRLIQLVERAINLYTLETLLPQFQKLFAVFAFAIPDDRREQITARALLHGHDTINHILYLLRFDRKTGRRAVGCPDTGKKQTHIIVNLGDSTNRRTRVLARRLLLDRNCRTEAADMINVWLFHHIKELARVGRKAFHIAALSFGVDRIEG